MAEEHSNPSSEQVKSANSWEKADLGSSERNEKFLRLMGAKKKEHHGRIVIGDGTTRGHRTSSEEAEKLAEGLTEQYQQGLEHTLAGKRRHLGLGFHEEPPAAAEEEEGGVKGEATKDLMGPDSEENGAEAPPTTQQPGGKAVRDEDSREAPSEENSDDEDDDDDEEDEEEEEEEGDYDDYDDENDDGDDGPSPPKKKK